MKTIWKVLITASFATALIVPSMAQQAGPTGGGLQSGSQQGKAAGAGRGGLLKISRDVLQKVQPELSKDQKKKISGLEKKMTASVKDLREKAGDRAAMREAVQKLTEEYRAGLMEILTPAQKTSYQELYKEALAKLNKDRKDGKNGKGGN